MLYIRLAYDLAGKKNLYLDQIHFLNSQNPKT